jgi:hypothetical protein
MEGTQKFVEQEELLQQNKTNTQEDEISAIEHKISL